MTDKGSTFAPLEQLPVERWKRCTSVTPSPTALTRYLRDPDRHENVSRSFVNCSRLHLAHAAPLASEPGSPITASPTLDSATHPRVAFSDTQGHRNAPLGNRKFRGIREPPGESESGRGPGTGWRRVHLPSGCPSGQGHRNTSWGIGDLLREGETDVTRAAATACATTNEMTTARTSNGKATARTSVEMTTARTPVRMTTARTSAGQQQLEHDRPSQEMKHDRPGQQMKHSLPERRA